MLNQAVFCAQPLQGHTAEPIIVQVFEGVRNKKGVRASLSRELTRGEKKRRVVLKRVNTDNLGMRSDFLRSGTMAQVRQWWTA